MDVFALPARIWEYLDRLNFNSVLKRSLLVLALAVFWVLAACSSKTAKPTPSSPAKPVNSFSQDTLARTRSVDPTTTAPSHSATPPTPDPTRQDHTDTPAPVPTPIRLLTVCLGQEPQSLFLYQAYSSSARSVLQAVYDGPWDIVNYETRPVILSKLPAQADGDVAFLPVEVKPGELVADESGNLVNLAEGVRYRPSGCSQSACAQTYTGSAGVTMDQMVVKYQLLEGLQWSDGKFLTADDSVYSFEVARSLYPTAQPEKVIRTASYLAVDTQTVEWRGLPGVIDPSYSANFYSPLPRHAWGSLSKIDLLQSDATTRKPLGWGPYIIKQWTAGDHITLEKNPNYFRAREGLPHFDNLVFRFVDDGKQMLDALLTGECDMADSSVLQDVDFTRLVEAQASGQMQVSFQPAAWELALFGIQPYESGRIGFFGLAETRRAIALCIDRSKMAAELWHGQSVVLDTYVSVMHPLVNPSAAQYAYEPQQASSLLESIGWLDTDGDPATPRLSQGVVGVPDGTPFEFTYLISSDAERPQAAQILVDSLAKCGIRVHVEARAATEILAAGPQGPLFGRAFEMAQLAFPITLEPACEWFTSAEIPGPYPEYPLGWGGANASGYSSVDFDQACQAARYSLPGSAAYQQAHFQAQAIFASDLPALPLYLRLKVLAMRPGLCGVEVDASTTSALWNLETWVEAEDCAR